ncbi:hypothetical protein CAOG_04194 [Capsaspora owczarzaki ATCC 30864]|uniref:TBC1 domain family member 7 n=1 Tax=Capsaspora owczarzaki (strain ATCC 30864) TaxID=595528 RepID=A0A0D2WPM0_CAPO3|nr:hypothetical protein CAOG_04194 [Capsaspora owczarzaki ATCC 30864]KJE93400.1 hypothetical protein CAOG_004194 [Capsaspora owczarzaki ATCC 30864]|eukprot:XP_004348019.1 hypothetical protein CAOG_04194 [Capsaspora owczarzaki ATCC 30864]
MGSNFRATYYKTLGMSGVEVKQAFDAMLKEEPIDIRALVKFLLRHDVPVAMQVIVWKVVLGVLPAHRHAWERVERQRKEHFDELQRTTFVLLGRVGPEQEFTTEIIASMCALNQSYFGHRLEMSFEHRSDPQELEHTCHVARMFCALCPEECDAFWLCSQFLLHQRANPATSEEVVKAVRAMPFPKFSLLYYFVN